MAGVATPTGLKRVNSISKGMEFPPPYEPYAEEDTPLSAQPPPPPPPPAPPAPPGDEERGLPPTSARKKAATFVRALIAKPSSVLPSFSASLPHSTQVTSSKDELRIRLAGAERGGEERASDLSAAVDVFLAKCLLAELDDCECAPYPWRKDPERAGGGGENDASGAGYALALIAALLGYSGILLWDALATSSLSNVLVLPFLVLAGYGAYTRSLWPLLGFLAVHIGRTVALFIFVATTLLPEIATDVDSTPYDPETLVVRSKDDGSLCYSCLLLYCILVAGHAVLAYITIRLAAIIRRKILSPK